MNERPAWICEHCGATTRGASNRTDLVCGRCRTPKDGPGVPAGERKAAPKRVAFLPKPAQLRAFANRAEWHHIVEEAKAGMLADIRAETKRPIPKPRVRADGSERYLLEVSPVDLHVGKYAWGEETGEDYDITIAERVFTDAITEILDRAKGYSLDGIVLVVGNDLLQTDSEAGTTTAGTHVDTDSRWAKSFRRARAINSWAIRQCAAIAPTRVVVVPGNHDSMTAFCIGEVLDAEFHDTPHVEVDRSLRRRKYLRYGVNLIGWTHGNEEKHADLPLIMAQECPEEWSKTIHREFHTGHLHKMKETRFTAGDSFNGVRVRVLPSLCSPDAWHYMKGYVHEKRACEAYLWSRERGYAGHISANVLPDRAA